MANPTTLVEFHTIQVTTKIFHQKDFPIDRNPPQKKATMDRHHSRRITFIQRNLDVMDVIWTLFRRCVQAWTDDDE